MKNGEEKKGSAVTSIVALRKDSIFWPSSPSELRLIGIIWLRQPLQRGNPQSLLKKQSWKQCCCFGRRGRISCLIGFLVEYGCKACFFRVQSVRLFYTVKYRDRQKGSLLGSTISKLKSSWNRPFIEHRFTHFASSGGEALFLPLSLGLACLAKDIFVQPDNR